MSQNSTREDDGEAGGDTSVSLGHEDDTWSNERARLHQIVIEKNIQRRPEVVSADLLL